MDFGDILKEWDNQQHTAKTAPKQQQKSHKKPNAPTKEEKEAMRQGYTWEQQMEADNKRHINPMELWLNRYGTVDKDKISDEAKQENDNLEQNNNFIIGAFELVYITNNVQDLVENIKIRIENSQKEKENQIKNNLDIKNLSFKEKTNILQELREIIGYCNKNNIQEYN